MSTKEELRELRHRVSRLKDLSDMEPDALREHVETLASCIVELIDLNWGSEWLSKL